MDEVLPIHVVSSDPGRRDRLAKALEDGDPSFHDSLSEVRGPVEETRCVIVVDAEDGIPFADVLALCRDVADHDEEKLVFLAESESTGLAFRPLSVGFALSDGDLGGALDPNGDSWPPFELHEILRFVARIRHDINNPLTAGMAETQLLLMDLGEEGEVGESLVTIQRQLKRIQGMVQDLAHLRRPPPASQA